VYHAAIHRLPYAIIALISSILQRGISNNREITNARFKADENGNPIISRLVTRDLYHELSYTPAPDENALLKHIDGAGKVDGSVVVVPTNRQMDFYRRSKFIRMPWRRFNFLGLRLHQSN
jgi:hypothetical protein